MNGSRHLSRIALALLAATSGAAVADQTTPVQGIHDKTPTLVALQNATIYTEPGKRIEHATLVVENGKIKAINSNNRAPQGARVIDASGQVIYPGFIDPYGNYGVPQAEQPERGGYRSKPPLYNNKREGGNASNDAIHAQSNWVDSFAADKDAAQSYIAQGFTAVQSAQLDGILQGRAVTVSLADKIPNDLVYRAQSKQFASFDKGSSMQQYPSSLMGSIALLRQALSDANWYEQAAGKQAYNGPVEYNAALAALTDIEEVGVVFQVDDELSLLRADQLLDEFKVPVTYVASGFEYARVDAVKATQANLIVPLNFPAAPAVTGVDDDLDVDLADLRHWERAPGNPAALAQAGIDFSLTLSQLEDKSQFWPNLRKAVKHGLSEQQALAALTTVPARIAGISDKAGKLAPGYMADFVVASDNLFNGGEVMSVWLQGQQQTLKSSEQAHFAGTYQVQVDGQSYRLNISGDEQRLQGQLNDDNAIRHVSRDDDSLSFVADLNDTGAWRFKLSQSAQQQLSGTAVAPDGRELQVSATRTTDDTEASEQTTAQADVNYVSRLTYPNVAYGLSGLPERQNLLIKNATVWTSAESGILENTDILIRDGEFSRIGQDLSAPSGYQVIDAQGKHVTPGIIDEHSHIAISQGVNEGSEAITAEVRIGDVVNPDDIHIYRSLAGGTTMAQLLHGSANPIGGQAQVIKLRWGTDAATMKFDAAPGSIKFALGENVKQSNWGENYTVRYPQTRMGVQTIMRDGFQTALEYQRRQQQYDDMSRSERQRTAPPRRDYRLDTLLEILNKQRFVHAHSYVQSEILMLIRLAEEFGFTLTTFTHILEGYKVADEMAAHGASGSTFADWWAYKFEVYDAIPQNACLMQQNGVLTSVNSDSNDLQRRLNTEAAKSVRYCGMSPADALKMVTINPAKQLKIDQYVGSIEAGKQADFVIWDENPLTSYAHVEQTWINARKFFDRQQDIAERQAVYDEKQQLIQKVLAAGESAKQGAQNGYKAPQPTWHCDTEHDFWLDHFSEQHHQHLHAGGGQH
ncbi:amidohydrolase family protein [Idiomarina xiamenensis]|uniref:Amidohydrolase n=1 Tax=Idiomarina xiamenensis 10-D-4 TaxID=740709 RepID=K2KCC3_9GAMM|nr:amidohydrolase family protein [Idiomarina xiamenensis]EKE84277.1 amidohydrolase [Idiomarina xiamenensis 10-D-4]